MVKKHIYVKPKQEFLSSGMLKAENVGGGGGG